MTFKRFIKKLKKDFSFRKKVLLFGGLGIIVIGGSILAANSDFMFASVLNLNQQAQQRKINFSKKIQNPLSTKQDTCVDTDGGINYYEKGIITTVINGYQRVEQDSCNTNGTLRERFCGQPGHPAGLLRSENFVNCEYGCYDGACITTGVLKDVAIESGKFIASDSQHASIEIYLKNIGTVAMSTDGIGHELSLDGNTSVSYGNDYILETTNNTNTILQPNDTYTIFANLTLLGNNHFTNNSYIHVSISTYPDIDDVPSNNTYVLYLTGNILPPSTGLLLPDVIIENIVMLPSTTPAQYSDHSTNQLQLQLKNIGNGPVIFPQLLGQPRIQLAFGTDKGYGGGVLHHPITTTSLAPNESTTITINRVSSTDINAFYNETGLHWLEFSWQTQQEQERMNPNINDSTMIYESDGTNNRFKLYYTVLPTTNLYGDIIIENMSIQTNPAIVGNTTTNNKVYITIKNIGQGNIIIPYVNGANRFGLGCESNEGSFSINTTGLQETVLGPNQSISTELEGQPYNTLWYGNIGNKSMTCAVISQQQQGSNNPNPNDTNMIFETDGTNNSFTLNYEVVSSKKSATPSLRDRLRR